MRVRANVFFLLLAACAAVVFAALAGCGGSGGGTEKAPPAAGPGAPGAPAMLGQPLRPGEVMVDAEASPQRDGPYHFKGRYRVEFVQYAPEAPDRSFAGATPFVAGLLPAGRLRAKPLPLFHAAAKSGERRLRIDGRYFVEVTFGDFPYAMRFTPLR